jgi:hypothetical protein
MITEVTPRRSRTHARLTAVAVEPTSAATLSTASAMSKLRSVMACDAHGLPRSEMRRPKRVSSAGFSPRRYFPVRRPPPRGLYTMVPRPWRWAAGSTSVSISREMSE